MDLDQRTGVVQEGRAVGGQPGLEAATQRVAEAFAHHFGKGAIDGKIQALVISAA